MARVWTTPPTSVSGSEPRSGQRQQQRATNPRPVTTSGAISGYAHSRRTSAARRQLLVGHQARSPAWARARSARWWIRSSTNSGVRHRRRRRSRPCPARSRAELAERPADRPARRSAGRRPGPRSTWRTATCLDGGQRDRRWCSACCACTRSDAVAHSRGPQHRRPGQHAREQQPPRRRTARSPGHPARRPTTSNATTSGEGQEAHDPSACRTERLHHVLGHPAGSSSFAVHRRRHPMLAR